MLENAFGLFLVTSPFWVVLLAEWDHRRMERKVHEEVFGYVPNRRRGSH